MTLYNVPIFEGSEWNDIKLQIEFQRVAEPCITQCLFEQYNHRFRVSNESWPNKKVQQNIKHWSGCCCKAGRNWNRNRFSRFDLGCVISSNWPQSTNYSDFILVCSQRRQPLLCLDQRWGSVQGQRSKVPIVVWKIHKLHTTGWGDMTWPGPLWDMNGMLTSGVALLILLRSHNAKHSFKLAAWAFSMASAEQTVCMHDICVCSSPLSFFDTTVSSPGLRGLKQQEQIILYLKELFETAVLARSSRPGPPAPAKKIGRKNNLSHNHFRQ